ncbi:ketosteroid isomerase [Streptomyces antibioticus]|nr:nuclear transport factor 2 family protein [Streptomyces antibioticus]KUN25470.1 ketosteroid isomerase [Streptomyces antibioticus]
MTTATQTSRTVAEKFPEHLGRQDRDSIQELFTDQIDRYAPDSTAPPWTGHRTRREEAGPYFTTMWQHFTNGQSKVALERFNVDCGDVGLPAVFTHTAAPTGKESTTPAAPHLATEDGRITRMHLPEDTPTAAEAFNAS